MPKTTKNDQLKANIKKYSIYVLSLLGAAGTGLQNYIAVTILIKDLMSGAFAATKAGIGIIHGIALAFGGLCSSMVNLCINIGLLESFFERITKKKIPTLKGWQRFRYWFGNGIFITTGLLFGLTTFAFGSVGVLAAFSIAAGIFVAGIMMIQELETWLESFDNAENEKNKSLREMFNNWKATLTPGKALGSFIALGNVLALSLLFTMGLTTFLTGVGVAALPSLIIAAVVAFTGGAFTEFYFYNSFLAKFCDKITEKWQAFQATKYPTLGIACGAINALVNGVLSFVGIAMMTGLLTAASITVPPLGIVIAIAAIASVFSTIASFILGLDFWINNSKKITGYFAKSDEKASSNLNEIKYIKLPLTPRLKCAAPSKKISVDKVPLLEKELSTANGLQRMSLFSSKSYAQLRTKYTEPANKLQENIITI